MADRFLQHDARFAVGQPGNPQVVGDGYEQVGSSGQVVDAGQPSRLAEVAGQAAEISALRRIHGEVVEAGGEALPHILVEIVAGDLRPAMAFSELEVLITGYVAAGEGR